nr:hypothetical protein [Tanacetum cinerariifolium]
MQTRSSSRIVSDQSSNPTSSMNPNPKGRNCGCSKQRIENSNLEEQFPPIVTMADQRTMAQLLQAPTEGYEDAIIVPVITADNFELKNGGNFLDKMPSDYLRTIERKSKVRYSHDKIVAKVSTNASTSGVSPDVVELKDLVRALLLDKKAPAYQAPAPQTQGVLKEDISSYVKANDAVMKNMQTQDNGIRLMLAPRSASAKHSAIPGKSHGIKNLHGSSNFS